MPDLKSFARHMRVLGARVELNAGKALRDVTVAVAESVVIATPVKEGRARRNWQTQVGSPKGNVLDAPGTPDGGAGEAISNAREVASTLKSGDTVHLTNNVPYIDELNKGSSRQAPAMFVQASVIRGIERIKTVRLLR